MKFDIAVLKSKLNEVKKKKAQPEVADDKEKIETKKVSISVNSVKNHLISFYSKDKKAKHTMKQSERGVILIVGSLLVGYITYSFLYQPAQRDYAEVQKTHTKTEQRRMEIQTQMDNQSTLLKQIQLYGNQLRGYKLKYPNYRTENEILKVIEEMLAKEKTAPSTFVKGNTVMAQKSKMQTFITSKALNMFINDISYFGEVDENGQPVAPAAEGSEIPESDRSNFEFTEVSFSVNDITQQRGLFIMDTFSKSERVIIPESLKLISDENDRYRLEATVLFFAYRDTEKADPLF